MTTLNEHPTIDSRLKSWEPHLGPDFKAYRYHVYRVFNLTVRRFAPNSDDLEKLRIAAAFHDIGIWLDKTIDYLQLSIDRAQASLANINREAWAPTVCAIIDQHHKVFPWHGHEAHLVDAFRRSDWLDVCLFALPSQLERGYLKEVLETFPRAGFHWRLEVDRHLEGTNR